MSCRSNRLSMFSTAKGARKFSLLAGAAGLWQGLLGKNLQSAKKATQSLGGTPSSDYHGQIVITHIGDIRFVPGPLPRVYVHLRALRKSSLPSSYIGNTESALSHLTLRFRVNDVPTLWQNFYCSSGFGR